jgi:phosphoserine phosphatase RsbU/P
MKERIELNLEEVYQDLELAQEMYQILTPKEFPLSENFDISCHSEQVFGIGGDFFDVKLLPSGVLTFAIGDISGKGISAALMMANLRFSLHKELGFYSSNLAGIATSLNQMVLASSPSSRYLTMFFAQFDPKSQTLSYINAGHNSPLLFRRSPNVQAPRELSHGGTVIGLIPNAKYQQKSIKLCPGDFIIAYTDGISEARDINGEEMGLDIINKECLELDGDPTAGEILELLLKKVKIFARDAKQHDDMTLLTFRCL